MEIERIVRYMAAEEIAIALGDIHQTRRAIEFNEAARWFRERRTTPFGYGWCLHQSGINPNAVRRELNKPLHKWRCCECKKPFAVTVNDTIQTNAVARPVCPTCAAAGKHLHMHNPKSLRNKLKQHGPPKRAAS